MKSLFEASDFLRRVRRRLRFGDLSRIQLQLLRIEWRDGWAECDWLMRPADPWDSSLPVHVMEGNQTRQALQDALSLRNLIFESFPGLDRAELRMFRAVADAEPQLMMTGSLRRSDQVLPRVASIVMQAKLCGFRFSLTNGVLERMGQSEVHAGC